MPQLADTALETVVDENTQLSQQQLQELLQQLDAWSLDLVNQEAQLVRNFKFKNFNQALNFANQIGDLAEQENHHPSILVEWGKVTLRWWTHKIGGLHINDFIMAARSQRIYENRK